MTRLVTILFALYFMSISPLVQAIDNSEKSTAYGTELSADLEALSQAIQQSQLDEAEKTALNLQLDKAENWLTIANQAVQESKQLNAQVKNIEQRSAEINNSLQQLKKQNQLIDSDALQVMSHDELTKQLNDAQKQLQLANENFLKWDAKLGNFQRLATDGARQKVGLINSIAQFSKENPLPVEAVEENLPTRVENLSVKSKKFQLEAQLELLNLQLSQLEKLSKSAQMESDYWENISLIQTQIISRLQEQSQSRKAAQAESELQQVVQSQINPGSPLYPLYQKLIKLQEQKGFLINQEKSVQANINKLNTLYNQMKADFTRDQQIIELEGSRETVAQILHKRLESISKARIKASDLEEVREKLNQAVLQQLLISEQLRNIQQRSIDENLKMILSGVPESEYAQWQDAALELHMQYTHATKELQSLYPGFISKLSELNSIYLRQRTQYSEYSDFLNSHLLWLPNADMETLFSGKILLDNLHNLISLKNYSGLKADIIQAVSQNKLAIIVWLLLLSALIWSRSRFIAKLEETATKLNSIRSDSMLHTLKALFLTTVLATIVPLFLLGLFGLLNSVKSPENITQNLQSGLANAAILVFILGGVKQICRPAGLAEKHYKWNSTATKVLFKELTWAVPFGAVMVILIAINTDVLRSADQQVIGRLAFITLMIGLLVLIYRLWSPHRETVKLAKLQQFNDNWMQFHFIWYGLLLLVPILLIWSTISGYFYSAILMAERINLTIGLFLLVFISRESLLRYIYLSERKQHYEERLKHLAEIAQQKSTEEDFQNKATEFANIEEPEINYQKLNQQVKQTVNLGYLLAFIFGLWVLWGDILVALNLIGDSTLPLNKSQLVDGVSQQVPLTLGDLLQGLSIGAITLILAKNLPGILEYTVLKFLPISNASRYAISSLTQYLIGIIGFVIIFRALGIEWSNIQWLVAALSVGLGFGLQEIVANFISGIILLFEQPIRVGDIVTVNNVTGKVSKIRIRATTIVNWDRQELLIPNKDIITGELINWSLSDPITRVKADVGIAYGSDVNKAMQLIQEAGESHPAILKDPQATVVFESFGDNSLLLSFRGYIEDLENRLQILSELNGMINDKLNEAGIVISFPQRDVHLDTLSPLEIKLTRSGKTDRKTDAETDERETN